MHIPTDTVPCRSYAARLLVCGLLAAIITLTSSLALAAAEGSDLTELDIEDLAEIEVTSLSKKAQRLAGAPAAVFVLSAEDIRRSGLRTIPELLRMVPGLQVARLSGNRWAVSSRGFNSLFSDKMLVMIDGRSLYTPLFAGVYWDTVGTLIEDIERIEVIRGPGGTLWGANAVNGVINIVTRDARDSEGALVSAGYGNIDRFISGRWGASAGEDVSYRGYVSYFDNQKFESAAGVRAHDEYDQLRGGIRVDWRPTENDHITIDAGAYQGDSEATLDDDIGFFPGGLFETKTEVAGSHVLARVAHVFEEGHDAALQVYYDRTQRDDALWDEWRNTADVDFQHRFGAPCSSEVVWGLGYRFTEDDVDEGLITFEPDGRTENLYTGFVQAELPLFDERVRLTAGTKLEHNVHTGFEVQPSARLAVVPNERHTLWASFTRAVRTPARSNDDLQINQIGGMPFPNSIRGNRGSRSETVLAYEAGYRFTPTDSVALDVAAYVNDYEHLQTLEVFSQAPPDIQFDNKMSGWGHGVEVYGTWRALDGLRLQAWYSYAVLELDPDSDSVATTAIPLGGEAVEDGNPTHTAQLRSSIDLPCDLEFESAVWFVDEVRALDISHYWRVDLRLGWRPIESLELSVAAQNVNRADHQEWGPEVAYQPTRIPRTVYGAVTWRY